MIIKKKNTPSPLSLSHSTVPVYLSVYYCFYCYYYCRSATAAVPCRTCPELVHLSPTSPRHPSVTCRPVEARCAASETHTTGVAFAAAAAASVLVFPARNLFPLFWCRRRNIQPAACREHRRACEYPRSRGRENVGDVVCTKSCRAI